MKQQTKVPSIEKYVLAHLGGGLFFLVTYVWIQVAVSQRFLQDNNLGFWLGLVFLHAIIFCSLFFLLRKNRYLSIGYILGIPLSLFMICLFILDLIVHPPSEE